MKPEHNVGTFLGTYNVLSQDRPGEPAEDLRKAMLERLQQGEVAWGELRSAWPKLPEPALRKILEELVKLRLVELGEPTDNPVIRLSAHARKALSYLSVA